MFSPKVIVCGAFLLMASAGWARAGELVYQPINPNFGGNPLNGNLLLNLANIQNQHKDDGSSGPGGQDESPTAINTFAETLQRRLLAQFSSDLVNLITGENALDQGQISVADTFIAFETVNNQVSIDITDLLTGETTNISFPVLSAGNVATQ